MNKTKIILVILLVVITIITCIKPIYPHEQFLQHAGTLLLVIPLIVDLCRNRMPTTAFVGIVLFTLLHVIGARYIYSYVPYKEWSVDLGIVSPDFFQDHRNHFDRLVHFSFGVLLFPYFLYICQNWFKQRSFIAILMAWLIIQTGSMIYELFEWLLTVVMTSEEADYYNGQQGDIWDAQKDMALAMLGSSVMAIIYLFIGTFNAKLGVRDDMLPNSFEKGEPSHYARNLHNHRKEGLGYNFKL